MNKVSSYCIAVSVVLELRNMELPPLVDRGLYLEKIVEVPLNYSMSRVGPCGP